MVERALVAGFGSVGQRHLKLLRARLPGAQIMVLRHSKCSEPPAGADFCTTFIEDAVAFAPEIAVIATPAPFHAVPAIALAKVGTNLLIEKPMAAGLDDAKALMAAAQEACIVLQVGYNMRFVESLRCFRAALMAGQIGRVASVRAEVGQYLPDWRPNKDWRRSVSALPELGGGVLLELSHELDFLQWIFGEVSSVRGWIGRQGNFALEVEDTAHAILQFALHFPAACAGPAPVATVNLDFIRRDTVRRCVAIGDEGTLAWDGIASQLLLSRPGQSDKLLFHARSDRDASYIAQLDAFLASVHTGAPVAVGSRDGIAALEIVEAIRHSHAKGGMAVIPDPQT